MFASVICHQGIANECVLRSTSWRNDRVDEDAFVESLRNCHESLVCVANIERNDGTFCVTNLEAFFAETLKCVIRYTPKCFQTFWLILDDMKCLASCCSCGWGATCAEDVGASCVAKPIDDTAIFCLMKNVISVEAPIVFEAGVFVS